MPQEDTPACLGTIRPENKNGFRNLADSKIRTAEALEAEESSESLLNASLHLDMKTAFGKC